MKTLDLRRWAHLTDISIQALLKYCPNLTSLDISDCPQITDKALLLISEKLSSTLQLIALDNCVLATDVGIDRGLARCPNLLTVSVNGCTRLSPTSFTALSLGCKRIQVLECSGIDGMTNERYPGHCYSQCQYCVFKMAFTASNPYFTGFLTWNSWIFAIASM